MENEVNFKTQKRDRMPKRDRMSKMAKERVNNKERTNSKENTKTEKTNIQSRTRKPRGKKEMTKSDLKEKTMQKKEEVRFKKSALKIIPLGGLLEVGKNMTVFEYE